MAEIKHPLGIESIKEPPFVKLYLNDIASMWKLSNPAQVILGEMLKLVTLNVATKFHNVVELTQKNIRDIKATLSESPNSANAQYSKGFKNLLESKILTKVDLGLYYISHEICSGTDWANTEMMRSIDVVSHYSEGKRTLITLINMHPKDLTNAVQTHRDLYSKVPFDQR